MSGSTKRRGGLISAAVHLTVFTTASVTAFLAGPSLGLPEGTWWVLALVALLGLPFAVLLGRNPQGALIKSPDQGRRARGASDADAHTPGEPARPADDTPWGKTPGATSAREDASGGTGAEKTGAARPALPGEPGAVGGRQPPAPATALPSSSPHLDERMVVVRPFHVTGPDPTIQHIGDGLAEELLLALGRLPESRVPARGSAFLQKGSLEDVEMGRRLGAAHVLTGSVSRELGKVRVTTSLIRVADGAEVWAEEATRRLGELSALPAQLATAVARVLGFTGADSAEHSGRTTENGDALDAYLRGRYHWHRRRDGLERSAELFELAVRLDPEFALGHAGRADANMLLGFYGYMDPRAAFTNATQYAERALELDDDLPQAWTAIGFVKSFYDWDWSRAEVSFRRAVEINPSYVAARFWYGMSRGVLGEMADWVRHELTALSTDPISVHAQAHLGWALLGARAFGRAEGHLRQALETDPAFSLGYWLRGRARLHNGQVSMGLADLLEGARRSRGNPITLGTLGYGLAKAGNSRDAQRHLESLQAGPTGWRWVRPSQIATVQIGLGQVEDAVGSLERALEERDFWLPLTLRRPEWDPVRDDARFQSILAALGVEEVPDDEYVTAAAVGG